MALEDVAERVEPLLVVSERGRVLVERHEVRQAQYCVVHEVTVVRPRPQRVREHRRRPTPGEALHRITVIREYPNQFHTLDHQRVAGVVDARTVDTGLTQTPFDDRGRRVRVVGQIIKRVEAGADQGQRVAVDPGPARI